MSNLKYQPLDALEKEERKSKDGYDQPIEH